MGCLAFSIKCFSPRVRLWALAQTLCALLESSLALAGAVLLSTPVGRLEIDGCAKQGGLLEWYSMTINPVVNHTRTLHCSHELVYPLWV